MSCNHLKKKSNLFATVAESNLRRTDIIICETLVLSEHAIQVEPMFRIVAAPVMDGELKKKIFKSFQIIFKKSHKTLTTSDKV